jgi:hypothetical protein
VSNEVTHLPTLCRFGDGDVAVVRVALNEGCLAYPDDREQVLCLNHFHKMTPNDSYEVLEELDPEVMEWYRGVARGSAR